MRKQRGLAMIAIYAIAIVGGLAALAGWWEYHNYQVRKAERVKWEAAMKVCEANTATAVEANKTLQASADKLAATITEQNAKITALKVAEATALKARDAALANALAKEQTLRAEISRLTIIAHAPPVQQTESLCHEAADILRAVAASRL